MAEYGTDSIQAIVNLYPRFDGKDKTQFLEYKDKLRVSLSFHRQSVAAILQGEPKPTTAQNSPAVATWTRANENLFGILFFTTELSAHNVVKRHMGKTREDGVGNGQAAWNALEKKYNSNTKEARRAYHEYLHNAKMKSGDDPDDFVYTMDGYRERLKDMGQPVPDERYEDTILQALPAEYERVCTASYERRDFHLADIRRMMSALYIDCLSRPNNSVLVAGRGVAMQATGGDNSIIKCHYCGNPGHRQKNCVAWIAAQCKDGNQQTTRSTPLGRWKRKAGGGRKSMWCSFHNQALAIRRWITTAEGHQLKEAGQGLPRGHSIGAQGLKRLTQISALAGPDAGWNLFSVKQDGALSGGESLSGTSECRKPREQPESLGEASPAGGVPQDGALEHPEQPMSSGCEHVEAPFARPLPLQHHGPSRHQVTPAATRAGDATQSIKERNGNDCTRLVEIATDSTLSQLRRLGLYTEAFLTDIAHQTDGAESVVEYACAATNDQMYSVGEETEVVPNTFEEATITSSRWVYKINAEKFIGLPRLVPAALKRPSSSWRGTVISAPEKPTSGNEPASMGMPNTDVRDLGRRVDDDKRSTGTVEIENGTMDHEKGGEDEGDPQEGELCSEQRRDEVRRKSDSGHSLRFFLFVSISTCSMESAF